MNRDEQIEAGARALLAKRLGPKARTPDRIDLAMAETVVDAITPPEGVDTAAMRRLATDYLRSPYGVTRQHLAAECIPLAVALCDELDRRTQVEGEWEQVGWRNAETGELRATWMPEKPKGPWEPVYVHRPAPTKGEE